MNIQTGSPATALALSNPWAVVPLLGHLDAYISAVNRMPMLTSRKSRKPPADSKPTTTSKPPASWCFRTCVWWCRCRANTWATACPTAT